MTTTKLQYIAHYRSEGLTPIPLHEYNNGACTCEDRGKCEHAGKHPRIKRQKAIDATEADWQKWLRAWPDMNIGILTGADTGIFVVDVDPRHGGDKSLNQILDEHGELPVTVRAITGGGGEHYVFRIPDGMTVRNSVGDEKGIGGIAPGIDIRGNGGLIVVEPSTTKGAYKWS